MRHQDRQLQLRHDLGRIERTAAKPGANLGRDHHVERQHGLEIVGGRLFGETAVHEGTRRGDVGGEIFRRHQGQVFQIVAGQRRIGLAATVILMRRPSQTEFVIATLPLFFLE